MRVRLTVTLGDSYSMGAEPGRWSGKPVRIRRGPATVTGGSPPQGGICRRSLSRHGAAREGVEGRPGSQETFLRPPSRTPSWKGVAPRMKVSLTTGLVAGLLAVAARRRVAAPVTVDRPGRRREHGRCFEGPVTTDVRPFNFAGACSARRATVTRRRRRSPGDNGHSRTGRSSTARSRGRDLDQFANSDYWAEWVDRGVGYERGAGRFSAIHDRGATRSDAGRSVAAGDRRADRLFRSTSSAFPRAAGTAKPSGP